MNARSAFIIFIFTASFLSTFSLADLAFGFANSALADSLRGQGIAAKHTRSYATAYATIVEAPRPKADDDTKDAFETSRFTTLCGDSDNADQVEWSHGESGALIVIFTCADFYGSGQANEGVAFSFVMDPRDGSLFLGKQFDFKREVATGGRIRLSIKETASFAKPVVFGVAGSVATAVAVASKEFPGERDKKFHAGTSAGLAAVFTSLAHHYFGLSKNKSAIAGGIGSCLVGASKETADPYLGGNRSREDMKANLIGCALGAVGMRIAFEFE